MKDCGRRHQVHDYVVPTFLCGRCCTPLNPIAATTVIECLPVGPELVEYFCSIRCWGIAQLCDAFDRVLAVAA